MDVSKCLVMHSFGDIKVGCCSFVMIKMLIRATKYGVATQCLKASKCKGANDQYWANVLLKYVDASNYFYRVFSPAERVNVKLGGINVVLDRSSLSDPNNPTIVMGDHI